jgi:stage V sporulation protein S
MASFTVAPPVPGAISVDIPEILKVSSRSRPAAVAGAIAGIIRQHRRAELQAVGAAAVNQATKAIAIARRYLAPEGLEIVSLPDFVIVSIAEQDRTAMRLVVELR